MPYGVIEIGTDGQIKNMKEKPELSFFTNTGCYIVEPRVIDEMKTGRNVSFPDIIMEYKKK
ncbi:nucleotidyltransferase, partial [Firmicutes bacterium AF16-15]